MQFKGGTCEVCGKTILTKRKGARFCQDKSTCRVAYYRKQKQAKSEAEKLTVGTDDYMLFQSLTGLGSDEIFARKLTDMLTKYGKDAFHDVLIVANYAAEKFGS